MLKLKYPQNDHFMPSDGMEPAERMLIDRARERAMADWRERTAEMERMAERAAEMLKVANDPTRSISDRRGALKSAREYEGTIEGDWERMEQHARRSAHQVLEGAALGVGILVLDRVKKGLDKDMKVPDIVRDLSHRIGMTKAGIDRDRVYEAEVSPDREREMARGMAAPSPFS